MNDERVARVDRKSNRKRQTRKTSEERVRSMILLVSKLYKLSDFTWKPDQSVCERCGGGF